jgi:hypothetical protein
VERYEDLDESTLANEYTLSDTEALRQYNIHLYYIVLRGAARQGWVPPMADSLTLMNLYLKLGFVDLATALIEGLPQNAIALCHGAHIFRVNGQPQKALELLGRSGADGRRETLVRAQALFDLNRLEEAEALATEMRIPKDVQVASLRVKLASRLCLPMDTLLEREESMLDAKTHALLQSRE